MSTTGRRPGQAHGVQQGLNLLGTAGQVPGTTPTPKARGATHPSILTRATAPPGAAYPVDASVLTVTSPGWKSLRDQAPQALGMTYRFDPPAEGGPTAVTVRLRGQRLAVTGIPGSRDAFELERRLDRVVPGSGPVTVTVRAFDIEPGQWRVQADAGQAGALTLPRASAIGYTAFGPLVRTKAPGVRLGAWPAFVATGTIAGLGILNVLARHLRLPVSTVMVIAGAACLLGLIGAKLYFLAFYRDRQEKGLWTAGMAIQGFVLVTVLTVLVGARLADVPVGAFLDALAPALMAGMTIGRFGCFFGGCCAGQATGSRWGLWSSDRDLGVRRVPTQLFEAAMASGVGLTGLGLLSFTHPSPAGSVFVGNVAVYTLGRQLLFPLRDLPRKTSRGRRGAMLVSVAVLAADIAVVSLN